MKSFLFIPLKPHLIFSFVLQKKSILADNLVLTHLKAFYSNVIPSKPHLHCISNQRETIGENRWSEMKLHFKICYCMWRPGNESLMNFLNKTYE
jgi:hypothetical protein